MKEDTKGGKCPYRIICPSKFYCAFYKVTDKCTGCKYSKTGATCSPNRPFGQCPHGYDMCKGSIEIGLGVDYVLSL